MVNNYHCFLHFTKKKISYLTKHLHFPADLLSYVLCHPAGCFPALHQQLPCHLIPLLFLLLSGRRVMSPRDRWQICSSRLEAFSSASAEHIFFCNKYVFISSKAILILKLLPPIRPDLEGFHVFLLSKSDIWLCGYRCLPWMCFIETALKTAGFSYPQTWRSPMIHSSMPGIWSHM